MRHSLLRTLSPLWICALLAACGGSTPSAEEPAAEPKEAAEKPAEEPKAEDAEEKAEGGEEKDGDKDDGKMKDSEGKPLRTAKDILTAPEVVFMFSFTNSEPKEKAQELCDKNKDPKKAADCMTKAQKGFDDGVRFKEEGGKWWWITLKRNGEKLTSLHKIEVEFADDSEHKVTLKTKGKDKGKKPWANPPREVVVEVPNESELVLDDPKHGKLVYQAKIGITSD